MSTYTVQSGDTFSSISARTGIPVKTLMAANKGKDPKKLNIGDKLALPNGVGNKPSVSADDDIEFITYKVKTGDNASKIAKAHGISLAQLKAANPGVNVDNIKPGQKFSIPKKVNSQPTQISTSQPAAVAQAVIAEKTQPTIQKQQQVPAAQTAQASQNSERRTEVIRPAGGEYKIQRGDSYNKIAKRIYRELIKKDGVERLTTDEISKQIQAANPNILAEDLGKPKKDKIVIPELVYTQKLVSVDMTDEKFTKALDFVLSVEGQYSDDKDDKGGETCKGVTHETYKRYLKDKKADANDKTMSITKSVKDITDNEAAQIYYNYYYYNVNVDDIKDPKIAVLVFDTAVNCGPEEARKMLSASGGDVQKFLKLRRQHYSTLIKEDPSQKKYEKGWENRLVALEKYINNLT